MAFKASKTKKGLLEIQGIEDFVEKKIQELKAALRGGKKAKAQAKAKEAKRPSAGLRQASRSATSARSVALPLDELLAALKTNPRAAQLIRAGHRKNQLLRSLIPLYVGRALKVEITSGTMSRFWSRHGVKYAAPNAAKALREHAGFARRTTTGLRITPNGIKYVEAALEQRAA